MRKGLFNAMGEPEIVDVARQVWATKYRLRGAGVQEASVEETWRRVARAVAEAEQPEVREVWASRFGELLGAGLFLPGGRIIAGAGSGRRVTLFNCFVMGTITDSVEGILDALRESALTMHQGGGVGLDFSTLRPLGAPARASGGRASGPVSFMEIWDATCRTLLSTSARRGAMMATMRCDHPDIERFVDAKRTAGVLTGFNVSVLASDAFIRAVRGDAEWRLVFPTPGAPGAQGFEPVERIVRARALWDHIVRAAHESAEPGVLFVDRINAQNNLGWRERISATNPCGEIPLPPYGACLLGSLDLTAFVRAPFTARASVDAVALTAAARLAVRLLDDVIDVSGLPLEAQAREARGSRRIGLGITGLADALIMLGLRYDSAEARAAAEVMMRTVCHAAYRCSVELARERGPFPFFEREPYLDAPFVRALPDDARDGIAGQGIRNSHLTAIAPAGSVSLLAGGVSSGLEPVFAARYRRTALDERGEARVLQIEDPAVRAFRARGGVGLPEAFVGASEVGARAQLQMQAVLQRHVDNAISKTVSVPAELDLGAFRTVYEDAYDLGLKGCTAYRPSAVRGAVLASAGDEELAPHCCPPGREAC
jgi:ribonucleoside-diphosphate reductase alpha chain